MALKHLLLGILVTAIWGANFSVIRLGLADLDPFVLACARFALSAFPLILFVPRPSGMRWVAVYGALFGGGLWGLVNLGIHAGVAAGLASLLLQLSAFFTIALASLVLGERIGRQQWLGMALAGLGLAVIMAVGEPGASRPGLLLIVAAAFAWSVCNLIVRRAKPADMFAFLVWACAYATLALLVLTLWARGAAPFARLLDATGAAALFSIGFQAWVTTLFGYWVWNSLMKTYPVSQVAPLSLLVPVAGLLTSHLAYGETIGAAKLLAALCILSGIGVMFFGARLAFWRRAPGCSAR